MTNTLAKLDERGFIVVRPNPDDGRSKLVYLTDAGRAFQQKGIEALGPTRTPDLGLGYGRPDRSAAGASPLRAYLDTNRDL